MKRFAKHGLVWTVLLALCVQGIAAVISSVRGPVHVHGASRPAPASEAAQGARRAGHFDAVLALAAGYAQAVHLAPRAHHASHHHHGDAQRHYHLPGSDAVLVQGVTHDDGAMRAERTSRGESASAAFVALIPEGLVLAPVHAGAGFGIGPLEQLISCTLHRIERPPRSLSA